MLRRRGMGEGERKVGEEKGEWGKRRGKRRGKWRGS
jgi:hypothetical protein